MFRQTQSSFEIIRKLFESKAIVSFSTAGAIPSFQAHQFAASGFDGDQHPMYEFFQEAAEEPVPLYRCELAKSGRSSCMAQGSAIKHGANIFISKSSIRIGHIDEISGTYTKWVHLECWRVPSRIWLGVLQLDPFDEVAYEKAMVQMNELLFCGLQELPKEDRMLIVAHVMNRCSIGGSELAHRSLQLSFRVESACWNSTRKKQTRKSTSVRRMSAPAAPCPHSVSYHRLLRLPPPLRVFFLPFPTRFQRQLGRHEKVQEQPQSSQVRQKSSTTSWSTPKEAHKHEPGQFPLDPFNACIAGYQLIRIMRSQKRAGKKRRAPAEEGGAAGERGSMAGVGGGDGSGGATGGGHGGTEVHSTNSSHSSHPYHLAPQVHQHQQLLQQLQLQQRHPPPPPPPPPLPQQQQQGTDTGEVAKSAEAVVTGEWQQMFWSQVQQLQAQLLQQTMASPQLQPQQQQQQQQHPPQAVINMAAVAAAVAAANPAALAMFQQHMQMQPCAARLEVC